MGKSTFLWVVIKSTVAITGVIMGISLIYNPYRLEDCCGGCKGGWSRLAKWGVLVSKITHHTHTLPSYYLLPKVKVVAMMTIVAVAIVIGYFQSYIVLHVKCIPALTNG